MRARVSCCCPLISAGRIKVPNISFAACPAIFFRRTARARKLEFFPREGFMQLLYYYNGTGLEGRRGQTKEGERKNTCKPPKKEAKSWMSVHMLCVTKTEEEEELKELKEYNS